MEERARKGIFWERKDTYAVVGKRVFLSFVLASSLLRDEKKKARKGQRGFAYGMPGLVFVGRKEEGV